MERIEIEAQNNLCVARQYAYILETFNVSKGRVPITKKNRFQQNIPVVYQSMQDYIKNKKRVIVTQDHVKFRLKVK